MLIAAIALIALGGAQGVPPLSARTLPRFAAPTEACINDLTAGNYRFVMGKAIHLDQDPSTRGSLVKGQSPQVIVLSCSDSRVPPEVVFDQGLGKLFVVRTAGEALDFTGTASIEYAVVHFHPKVLLVLGHDYCGAVSATLTTPKGKSAGSPDLDRLVDFIRPHLAGQSKSDDAMDKAVKANAAGTASDLVNRSAIVKKAVEGKSMAILRGNYHLKSGVVEFW